MKYRYSIIINGMPEGETEYRYSFGNTKDITFVIGRQAFFLCFSMSVKKKPEEIISVENNLFADAIKKAVLIHIIKFSENLDVRNVIVKVDEEERIFGYTEENPLIYSLVSGGLVRKIPEKWNDDRFIQSLLDTPKSKYDSRMAALFAYVTSKSKSFEIERFNYVWISFNGMYNYFWQIVKRYSGEDVKDSEKNQLSAFMYAHNMPYGFIEGKSVKPIADSVQALVKRWDGDIPSSREEFEKSEFAKELSYRLYKRTDAKTGKLVVFDKGRQKKYYWKEKKICNKITPYSYISILLPYHLRCDTFHANKVIKLFSFSEESDVKICRLAADMVESVIEENLFMWFMEDYRKNIKEMAGRAAAGVKLEKDKKKKTD